MKTLIKVPFIALVILFSTNAMAQPKDDAAPNPGAPVTDTSTVTNPEHDKTLVTKPSESLKQETKAALKKSGKKCECKDKKDCQCEKKCSCGDDSPCKKGGCTHHGKKHCKFCAHEHHDDETKVEADGKADDGGNKDMKK